jgi:hypothetical protein
MRMLIVEDQEKHLQDAMATVQKLQQAFELEVRYASTLDVALEQLDWAEIVVTDLFFPEKPGESPDPPPYAFKGTNLDFAEECMSGIKLAKRCLDLGKPVVVCTSTWHHGAKAQPACTWMRAHKMELVDVADSDPGVEVPKKWTKAILLVIATHEKVTRSIVEKSYYEDCNDIGSFVYCYERRNYEGKNRDLKEASPTVAEVLRRYDSIPKDE